MSYVKHFTREVDEADDKVQVTTFKVGLKSREFIVALAKSPPEDNGQDVAKSPKVHECL